MLLARVEGNVVSTIRHGSLRGWRLLICQTLDDSGHAHGQPLLALDALGAGQGEHVILTSDGKSVREKVGDPYSPARYMTMAIVDESRDDAAPRAGEVPA
jgi:ethanolamine utilization protein EutN